MAAGLADLLGLDVTTTEFAVAVRDDVGNEDYVATPMRGATAWQNDPAFPAFDLRAVPGMLRELLGALQARGWRFDRRGEAVPGYVSVACRQHDMVVLGQDGEPLLPAISWQCNAAGDESEALRALGVERTVGMIEPRFVLPKLRCVLNRQPDLADRIGAVCMTGDWIAQQLTGRRSLSTSDALSNGLLNQQTRARADEVIQLAGLRAAWFPETAQAGDVVGTVQPITGRPRGAQPSAVQPSAMDPSVRAHEDPWQAVRELLSGWRFVAGLGDNHASAVGSGMTDDYRKLVVSAGTSGTINLSCPKAASLQADSGLLRFEFYHDALLLLLMLADCGAWYNRFLDRFAPELKQAMGELNNLALSADLTALRRVLHDDMDHLEIFPPSWARTTLGAKVADVQLSIALELLLRVKQMLTAVRTAGVCLADTFVLTGGLSQSQFFQCLFYAGVQLLAPGASVKVSGRTGPLRYKTSAYGALINAELPRVHGHLAALHASGNRFPLIDCVQPQGSSELTLQYLLRSYGV